MKKFLLILCILSFPILILAQTGEWVDTGGSTWVPTAADVQWEIKPIHNNVHDRIHNAWTVYNISSGPYHNRNWIWDGDNWVELEGSRINMDGVSVSSLTLNSRSFLHGFSGTAWDRLISDVRHYLMVHTSTNSDVNIYYDGNRAIVETDQDLRVESSTDSLSGIYYDNYTAIVEPDQDLRVESSTDSKVGIYYNGVTAEVQGDGELEVESSTGSLTGIYKDGNTADVDTDDELHVETSSDSYTKIYYGGNTAEVDSDLELSVEASSDSLVGIYQGGNTAKVRDGSSDNNVSSEQGLLTQSNMHAFDSNQWHRLLIQSTNYHNLRVALYHDDKVWEINDWDTDGQAEGRDGGIVYSYLSGWDAVNDDWDRLRVNPMMYLYVVTSSESWTRIIEGSMTISGGFLNNILSPVTSYLTWNQYLGLKEETTSYIKAGLLDNILNPVTTYLTLNQMLSLKEETTSYTRGGLLDNILNSVTTYMTYEQWLSLKEETTSYIDNFPADYPDSTAQSSLANIDTNTDNIYNQMKDSVTVSDIRYSGKVSTGTAGKSFTSGSLSITGDMEFYMFYTEGGNATITGNWFGGTKYVREGIPFKPDKLSIPYTNPVFDYVLDAGTTIYWDSNIVVAP